MHRQIYTHIYSYTHVMLTATTTEQVGPTQGVLWCCPVIQNRLVLHYSWVHIGSSMSSEYGVAGRLLNALRQECVHQLGVPMDDLRLVTAWDRSRLQVSKSGLRWLQRRMHYTLWTSAASSASLPSCSTWVKGCLQSPDTTGWPMQAVSRTPWANHVSF